MGDGARQILLRPTAIGWCQVLRTQRHPLLDQNQQVFGRRQQGTSHEIMMTRENRAASVF
jgi:hypothetical protein